MRNLFRAAVAASLALGPITSALAAAEPAAQTASAVQADPYDDLYASMQEGVDEQQTLTNVLDPIMAALQNELPELALMEDAHPGMLDQLRSSVRPIIVDYSARVKTEYRPRMVGLLRDHLSVSEARSVAAFYRSELGRKLMAGVSKNYSMNSTIRSAARNPDAAIDSKDVDRDLTRTGVQAYLALTPEERTQVELLAQQTPGMDKLVASQPALTALRTEMENAPLTADEQDRFNAIIKTAFNEDSDPIN